ncbi:broad specificity phosphatase PhoE [Streptomyces canus]|uniref:histidine phosphatase family protein n=1 Tax=unclassified Streptomyces TaxID=2593676 RepID=UPI000F64BD4D|nr:histidine phosphatase family protein [Streptomyces sp. RP5T]RRR84920.1 histidine phosphatase family protein [Streptomyces sp. RP5T]
MTVRLTLLCAAARTERAVRFADGPLDERALHRVRALAGTLPRAATRWTAPSRRCTETARTLGWESVTPQPALRDLDMGSWYGRTLDEVAATDAPGLGSWLADPDAAPHGGESVAQLCERVAAWLDALPSDAGRVLAVVEQAVARAAVVHALTAPHEAFWRVDVPPLSTVELSGRGGRWNLRMAELPLGPRPPR